MSTIIDGTTGITFPDASTQAKAVSQVTPFAVTASAIAGAELQLPEATANGVNYVAVKAPNTLAANTTFTLPAADGTAGQVLQTNASGTLSFGNVAVANGGTGVTTSTGSGANVLGTSPTITNAALTGSSSLLASILTNAAEVCTISATAATGTISYDVSTQAVLYYTTNASANWTLNIRHSSGTTLNTAMATGQSVTIAFFVTQGATAYYNNVLQIDGSAVTPKWQGGTAPTAGNASSIDIYAYTIIKTGNAAFTVFASQTKFA